MADKIPPRSLGDVYYCPKCGYIVAAVLPYMSIIDGQVWYGFERLELRGGPPEPMDPVDGDAVHLRYWAGIP